MPSDELLEVIKDIDKNGSSLFYYEAKRPDVVWDYRRYDMQLDNLILKGEIEEIAEGYSAFEAYLRCCTLFKESLCDYCPTIIVKYDSANRT